MRTSTSRGVIAELAYEPGAVQDAAKLGVLGASTMAALLGATILARASRTCNSCRAR